MADTGNTATLTLATSALTVAIDRITIGGETRETLEDSDLTTTNYKTYLPGDLREPPTLTISYFFDQSDSSFPSAATAAELATVTFPLKSGEGTAATYTGTGFIVDPHGDIEVANNELMKGTLIFKCDGKTTEPTFTAGSA